MTAPADEPPQAAGSAPAASTAFAPNRLFAPTSPFVAPYDKPDINLGIQLGMKLRWMPVLALGRRQGGGGAAALQPRGRRGGARLRPLMNLCMRYNRAAGRPGLPVGRGGTDRLPACTAGVPLVLAFQGPNWV